MKNYSYNRNSVEGRRLFHLLQERFNKGTLEAASDLKTFQSYKVPSVTQCRVNKVGFLFSSNLAGIKRPQIRVDSDVEMAWGDFSDGVTALDFTHDNQQLPLTYVQPLEDETLKILIDAGIYRDSRFEEVMNKLMVDEVFDAEADMTLTHLDITKESGLDSNKGNVPVLLVDPVNVVHTYSDPSTQTTLSDLVKRSALLAIELHKEGVKTDQLVQSKELEQDREVFLPDIKDVIEQEVQLENQSSAFVTSSELLDQEIDVTDQLKGGLSFVDVNENDRIRDLKARERRAFRDQVEESHKYDDEVSNDYETYTDSDKPANVSEVKQALDPKLFDEGLDGYEIEDDDGPEL